MFDMSAAVGGTVAAVGIAEVVGIAIAAVESAVDSRLVDCCPVDYRPVDSQPVDQRPLHHNSRKTRCLALYYFRILNKTFLDPPSFLCLHLIDTRRWLLVPFFTENIFIN